MVVLVLLDPSYICKIVRKSKNKTSGKPNFHLFIDFYDIFHEDIHSKLFTYITIMDKLCCDIVVTTTYRKIMFCINIIGLLEATYYKVKDLRFFGL